MSGYLKKIRFGHRFTFAFGKDDFPEETLFLAGAWRLAAEMAMRHPSKFQTISDWYPTGASMLWLAHKEEDLKFGIVSGGSVTVFNPHHRPGCQVCDAIPEEENNRFNTFDLVFAADIDLIAQDLEFCAGLGAPNRKLSLASDSVSYAVIRDLIWVTARSSSEITVISVSSTYDGSHERSNLLARFPGLRSLSQAIREQEDGDDRFEEENADFLAPLVLFEIRAKGNKEPELSLVFDLEKGTLHETTGSWPLMDEIKAGGNTLGIAQGLADL
jgi:hypothetical protein